MVDVKIGDRIRDVWFDGDRIFIRLSSGLTGSRPLEAFPLLKDADDRLRMSFEIGRFGDDIRWAELDEDIHVSSFFEDVEPETDNEVARIFGKFPELNVSQVARRMGINKSLLAKYIYGIKKPSAFRLEGIKDAIRELGRELQAV